MVKTMDVNIIPTYSCRLKCDYCFLGEDINDNHTIDLNVLEHQLNTINDYKQIKRVDLFGGELSVYCQLRQLIDIARKYTNNISLTTNLENRDILSFADQVDLSISLNPTRNDFKRNIKIIKSLDESVTRNLFISTVVLPDIIEIGPTKYFDLIDELEVRSLYFLQYYKPKNGRIKYNVSNRMFEQFIIDALHVYRNGNYSFKLENISSYLNDNDPRMSNYIFINPYNKYGCTVYNNKDEESFKWFDSFDCYIDETKREQIQYFKTCGQCQYYCRCYAEHFHRWKENDQCCGLYSLVDEVNKYF